MHDNLSAQPVETPAHEETDNKRADVTASTCSGHGHQGCCGGHRHHSHSVTPDEPGQGCCGK